MVSTLKTTTRSLIAPSSPGSLIGPIAALTMFAIALPLVIVASAIVLSRAQREIMTA